MYTDYRYIHVVVATSQDTDLYKFLNNLSGPDAVMDLKLM